MEIMPLISVIIPVHNVERFLRRCLDSVLGQTYKNLEIILVDDGSTDGSGKICDEYAANDNRVWVFHNANQGVSAARNCGLDNATGEYIAFVDSDDYIEPDMIERLYTGMIDNGATYSACGFNCVGINDTVLSFHTVDKLHIYSGIDALHQHYLNPNSKENFVMVCGKLFQRKIFENLRFCQGLLFEDIQIMPYILLSSEKVVIIPYVGYHYVRNNESITNKNDIQHKERLYNDSFKIWGDHLKLYEQNNIKDLAEYVKVLCVNKVIAHSLEGTIPAEAKTDSIRMARKFTRELIFSHVSVKTKIRYALFCILGESNFKKAWEVKSGSLLAGNKN